MGECELVLVQIHPNHHEWQRDLFDHPIIQGTVHYPKTIVTVGKNIFLQPSTPHYRIWMDGDRTRAKVAHE